MNEQLIGAGIGIVTTIIGGIFGYILSEVSARRREHRDDQKRSAAVRLIVGLEIERNLQSLRAAWDAIKQQVGDNTDPRHQARALVDTPLLPMSRDSLRSQLENIPSALSIATATKVFRLYDSLAQVETLRSEWTSALADQQSELAKFRQSATPPGQPPGILYPPRTPFDSKAEQNWAALESTVMKLLSEGNPLPVA